MVRFLLLVVLAVLSWPAAAADRGLAAVRAEQGGVYLSWRLLPRDHPLAAFNVYRSDGRNDIKLNSRPLQNTTDFIDSAGDLTQHNWYVTAAADNQRSALALKATAGQAITIASGTPAHGRKLAVGDLDADGRLDFVLRHSGFTTDPFHTIWQKSPKTYSLQAFNQDGKALWRYDMGKAIEMGIWYSPYVIYDLDGDGSAELIVKAGDESIPLERLRDDSGRVMHGPEYLRVISGRDGKTVLAQADWPNRHGFARAESSALPIKLRRYGAYNHWSRNFIAIAYLDGRNPYVVVNRGTYGKHKVRAYRYLDGRLQQVWSWENQPPGEGGDPGLWGQGAHALQAHDIDGDGRDEVVIGSLILDDDGTPLRTIGHGHKEHVDHVYIGDLDPLHIGLEMYYGAEWRHSSKGAGMIDLASGKTLWAIDSGSKHLHREGMCADIDARHPGIECYSGESNGSAYWLHSAQGEKIDDKKINNLTPRAVWWDADPQKELLEPSPDKNLHVGFLSNYPERQLLWPLATLDTIAAKDRPHQHVIAAFDLLGDWREELLVADRGRLIIYMSNIPASTRNPWLMTDRGYRLGVVNVGSGYYQQPMLGRRLATEPAPLGPLRLAAPDCRPIALHCFPDLTPATGD